MKFRCYIWGCNSDWEANCTDLDIAVQGSSLEITKNLLIETVTRYIHEVEKLQPSETKIFFEAPSCAINTTH